MTGKEKMIYILSNKTEDQLKDIILASALNYSDESGIVEEFALGELSKRIPENEFVDFCDSLHN